MMRGEDAALVTPAIVRPALFPSKCRRPSVVGLRPGSGRNARRGLDGPHSNGEESGRHADVGPTMGAMTGTMDGFGGRPAKTDAPGGLVLLYADGFAAIPPAMPIADDLVIGREPPPGALGLR